jgi:ubiquinone/menaquinone biosynthesis C-methylase UbiE
MKAADSWTWSPGSPSARDPGHPHRAADTRMKSGRDGARSNGASHGDEDRSAAPNFNRLAGIYRWMELASFGPWLQRCRCGFLDELRGCRKALVLGDGDGRFTERLLRANAEVRIDAVDASEAMLRALIRRAGADAGRVRVYCRDIRQWEPTDGPYDLIASHFFLDCLTTEEVPALAGKVRRAVAPAAVWVVSEFAVPEGWFGRLVARPMVSGLYWAFGLLTGLRVRRLPEYREALRGCGFRMETRRDWLGGLLISELWRVEDERAGETSLKG